MTTDDDTALDYQIFKSEMFAEATRLMREIRKTPSVQPYYRSRRERCQRDLARIWVVAEREGWMKRMTLLAVAQVGLWTRRERKKEAA